MGLWREQVVPRLADKGLDIAEVRELRDEVCRGLAGEVVEIGFGSGLNAAHYPPEVTQIWAVEPSDVAWRMAQPRILSRGVQVRRAGLDGEALGLPGDRYDAVLSTFTFCTISRLEVALSEIHRVLRPGGTLYFLEHGRSPDEKVARWQNRLQPVYGPVFGGCHITRSIADHLDRSELRVEELRSWYLTGAKPFAYVSLGRATKAPPPEQQPSQL